MSLDVLNAVFFGYVRVIDFFSFACSPKVD